MQPIRSSTNLPLTLTRVWQFNFLTLLDWLLSHYSPNYEIVIVELSTVADLGSVLLASKEFIYYVF